MKSVKAELEYSFVYLGDLHLDQAAHHDVAWLNATKPGIMQESEKYVRITETDTPLLLKQVRMLADESDGQIRMVVQGGDLVEGLCGSYDRQMTQFAYAKKIIKKNLGTLPFIAVKGNHDITGPGATEAYDRFMLPWMSAECGKPIESASFYFTKGPDLFVFFDVYNKPSLDWLQKTLRGNAHRYAFVVMHPPVVPYGARSAWHFFSKPDDLPRREALLTILGKANAIVLTAHLHKFSVLDRKTAEGSFVQFSVGSVIDTSPVEVKNHMEGVEYYNGTLVDLEPDFQPGTAGQRRKILEDERGFVTRFEYADLAGDAVLHVSNAGVTADIYGGYSCKKWKTVTLRLSESVAPQQAVFFMKPGTDN